MKLSLLVSSKILLTCCNFLLLASGSVLVTGGFLLLCDSSRILLSRLLVPGPVSWIETLPHPLFYYFALGVICLGLVLSFSGVLGCWAACLDSYCILTVYFIIIMAMLMFECGIYAAVSIWPHCLGLSVTPVELAHSLQREYGLAGHEQFTAAIDLAQSTFNCCGVSSSVEYDTSLWRLQALGHPSLAVPLSCCRLDNYKDPIAYLDPQPLNKTLCEAVDPDLQQGYRHKDGCMLHLEHWYQEQYILFLAVGLVIVLMEFAVLLSTVLSCTKVYKQNQETKSEKDAHNSNTYRASNDPRSPFAYSNDVYTMSNSFRQNYKIIDK